MSDEMLKIQSFFQFLKNKNTTRKKEKENIVAFHLLLFFLFSTLFDIHSLKLINKIHLIN